MDTIEIVVPVGDDWQELLIADLLDLDFEGFVQEDDRLKAYIPAGRWDETAREIIEKWLVERGLRPNYEERLVPKTNWNRNWEESIRPIVVEPFLVRPTWTASEPVPSGLIVLEIDPKMSFGTGYHESTRLVLRFLPEVVRTGDRVLDVGTGTGILAIAALKLGAMSALAFDNDEWAQENAVENFYLNSVADRAEFRAGDFSVVPESGFDLILANIQRNVLLGMMPLFREKTVPGGRVVLAGLLLETDADPIRTSAARHGFEIVREATEGEWWAAVLASPAA